MIWTVPFIFQQSDKRMPGQLKQGPITVQLSDLCSRQQEKVRSNGGRTCHRKDKIYNTARHANNFTVKSRQR